MTTIILALLFWAGVDLQWERPVTWLPVALVADLASVVGFVAGRFLWR